MGKIQLKIRVASVWQNHLGGEREKRIEIKGTGKIADLITILALPGKEIGLVLKNHKRAARDEILNEGDFIEFYPRAGGG